MQPLKILKIPNTEWFDINFNNSFYGTEIKIHSEYHFDETDTRTHIIWFKHHGAQHLSPVSTIYDATALDSIPSDWIPFINQKRIHIIIDTMEESWGPVYEDTINHTESSNIHLLFRDASIRLGIDPGQITWLTGDMNAESYCKDSDVNVKSVCMFLWSFVNIIKYGEKNRSHFVNKHDSIDTFLICPNRFPKAHRGYTVARLKKLQEQDNKNTAFDRIRFSFPKEIDGLPYSTIKDAYDKLKSRKHNYPNHFDRYNTFDWDNIKKHMYELHDMLPRQIDDVDFNTSYCADIESISSIGEYYRRSAFCLVTETWAEGRKIFISDAILAPILYATPFLLVGCRGSLEFLRSKGFKTFSDVVDESYDDIEDDAQRWDAVLNQVETLGSGKYVHDLQLTNTVLQEILDYNLNHIFDIAPTEELAFSEYLNKL
jgi:hypothetical protein